MQIIGVIVVWDDGHEQVVTCGETDAVEVFVRSGVLSIQHNGMRLVRDGASVKQTRWLKKESREERTR